MADGLMQAGEPVFEVYYVDNYDELTTPAHLCDSFDPEMHEADESFDGWKALSSFLDSKSDDSEVAWVEVGKDLAPVHQLCQDEDCDATAQTASAERLNHLRELHHLEMGH